MGKLNPMSKEEKLEKMKAGARAYHAKRKARLVGEDMEKEILEAKPLTQNEIDNPEPEITEYVEPGVEELRELLAEAMAAMKLANAAFMHWNGRCEPGSMKASEVAAERAAASVKVTEIQQKIKALEEAH